MNVLWQVLNVSDADLQTDLHLLEDEIPQDQKYLNLI